MTTAVVTRSTSERERAAIRIIAQARCEVGWLDKKLCFEHFPKDRHQWCWPCFARYVLRGGSVG